MNELELAIRDRPARWDRGGGSVVLHAGAYDVWAYRAGGNLYGLGVFRGNRNWQLHGFMTPQAVLSSGETLASMLAELVAGADEAPSQSTAKVVRINE